MTKWEHLCNEISSGHLDKLNEIAVDRWIHLVNTSSTIRKCIMHNTLFDLEEEPCWQCFNELGE